MSSLIYILVLNYNGKELLEKCLSSIEVASATLPPGQCRIAVIDNGSTDQSFLYCQKNHPDIDFIKSPVNDFLFTYNEVVKGLDAEFILILNNDIWVTPDFIQPLLSHMSQPEVFAVTCGLRNWDGENFSLESRPPIATVYPVGSWYAVDYDPAPLNACDVQVASGGASLIRRHMFIDLDGFDPLYRPGYSEDTDLSIRAWRRGWRIVYEPNSIVHHMGSVSMQRKFGSRVPLIALRNRILMVAKLFGNGSSHFQFILLYPKRMIVNYLYRNRQLGLAMWLAIPRLMQALWSRRTQKILWNTEPAPTALSQEKKNRFAAF